jgi:hypothetical protein
MILESKKYAQLQVFGLRTNEFREQLIFGP